MTTTIKQRQKLWNELAAKSREWQKMTDEQLFAEVKKIFGNVTEATRDECWHMLMMNHTEKMI